MLILKYLFIYLLYVKVDELDSICVKNIKESNRLGKVIINRSFED